MSNSFDSFGTTVNLEGSGLYDAGTSEELQHEKGCRSRNQELTGLDALPIDEFLRIVGLRVRVQRSVLRMSRKRLSEVSGVSERYLAQLESGQGNISIVLLRKVTAAIGITLGTLLAAEIPEIPGGNLNNPQDDAVKPSSLRNGAAYPATDRSLTGLDATSQRARLVVPEV